MKKRFIIPTLTLFFVLTLSTIGWAYFNNKPVAVIDSNPDSNLITLDSPLTLNHTSSTDPDGDEILNVEYEIRMRVQDNKGAWSDWTEKNFHTENVTVNLTNPVQGSTVTTNNTVFTADVSNAAAVEKVEFYVNDSKIGEDTTYPYEYSWEVPVGSNGAATAYAKAITTTNQSVFSPEVGFTIDVTFTKTLFASKNMNAWYDAWGHKYGIGAGPSLGVGVGDEFSNKALIQFNLAGIPANATVLSAQIQTSNNDVWNYVAAVNRITTPWEEPVVQGTGAHPASTALYPSGQNLPVSLVQGWLNNTIPNYGIEMAPNYDLFYNPDYIVAGFDSRTGTNPPKLVLQFK